MGIEKNSYEQIIELNSEKMKLEDEINKLKPSAIKQLYKLGYSMDNISNMLRVGKVNVVAILKGNKKKIGNTGRNRK